MTMIGSQLRGGSVGSAGGNFGAGSYRGAVGDADRRPVGGFASRAAALVAGAMLAVPIASAGAACHADSGSVRAALVELYTSEGCSSCPPADDELRRLARSGPRVVPLALHVDYWDSIGWKDPFAKPLFTERQAWEVRANGRRTSFTPHFFVDGAMVEDWRADLARRLGASTAPPGATITIDATPSGPTTLRVKVDAVVAARGAPHGPLQLFVVVTEGGLASQVGAGENRGVRLAHEAVARNWIGPVAVSNGDRASYDREVAVPQLAAGRIGVVAFVQDAATAEVLQAVQTGTCKPS